MSTDEETLAALVDELTHSIGTYGRAAANRIDAHITARLASSLAAPPTDGAEGVEGPDVWVGFDPMFGFAYPCDVRNAAGEACPGELRYVDARKFAKLRAELEVESTNSKRHQSNAERYCELMNEQRAAREKAERERDKANTAHADERRAWKLAWVDQVHRIVEAYRHPAHPATATLARVVAERDSVRRERDGMREALRAARPFVLKAAEDFALKEGRRPINADHVLTCIDAAIAPSPAAPETTAAKLTTDDGRMGDPPGIAVGITPACAPASAATRRREGERTVSQDALERALRWTRTHGGDAFELARRFDAYAHSVNRPLPDADAKEKT